MRSKIHLKSVFKKRRLWLLVPVILFAAGAYLLINVLSPALPPRPIVVSKDTQHSEKVKENRLYVPAIGVDVEIAEGGIEALEQGAWHRKPQNGNPEKGGNFVLSAHRFQLGWTPQQTRARSPFYHIDRLEPGDKIIVDYNKKRYKYRVVKKYHVDRYAVHIERESLEPKLTLYSCDLRGEPAGREVIEAKPI